MHTYGPWEKRGSHASLIIPPQAARLLGSASEFHLGNKRAIREAGGVAALARLLVVVTEVPLEQLQRLRLLPATAQGAHALMQLCKDCPDNMRNCLAEPDFLSALNCLMQVRGSGGCGTCFLMQFQNVAACLCSLIWTESMKCNCTRCTTLHNLSPACQSAIVSSDIKC